MGHRLGLTLPDIIEILAVEAEDVMTFGETCTPAVAAAIPAVTELVLQLLKQKT
jgi:hydrogenase maturation protease